MTGPRSPGLTRPELRRYSRALLVPEWLDAGAQERVKAAHVLVVGAGGLGSPVIASLAGAGVGTLTVADDDRVDLSNLHRQTLYATPDVGRPKAELAAARAQSINPHVQVRAAPRVTPDTLPGLLGGVTLVVDATDNFETRYLIADTCAAQGREWIWGAASGTAGMVSVFGPHAGLRDVFPDPGDDLSCDEAGVLGPVPALTGQLMALEALKVLGGVGQPLRGRLWTFDALTGRARTLTLRARAQADTP
ncbi:HesA/MoeB/ThiF family protein [Deinococcus soli (ex Cha et al. 2016)]|uniref:Adenylyltransferase/sulfurtransferase n=2 Tax=Deinococcus soli (ex Cha et al. 2016) TaxID=1309411 RepID=A0A0F7JQU6_9DEIO|nr:HesA/MoeB/ThiF family protein [Deinococcus soli (ex Cha et al. 2016)]AKH17098.1 molybdopterin biosynthesis protein MoeB [Deinococcus soli (ex Cha et al. 2016)]MDR6219864.1 adenylyltransferase/sulfurtransferase [Deinococcus soli (ex Cha et al. 2016)]MDR6329878.1 adenylyltransferase/sulfurtransferase [Deinococcus soli (ex Cha et al. 2016)]MDR6752771.1 adenylyltransferase/sulfurtransferase [Deinococcus soli (ex Cha et al. 2016)]